MLIADVLQGAELYTGESINAAPKAPNEPNDNNLLFYQRLTEKEDS